MKALRITAFAILALCFFGSAEAQVVLRARIGNPPPHRRVVVVRRGPGYYHRGPGYYHHPHYRGHYRHHPYRRY